MTAREPDPVLCERVAAELRKQPVWGDISARDVRLVLLQEPDLLGPYGRVVKELAQQLAGG